MTDTPNYSDHPVEQNGIIRWVYTFADPAASAGEVWLLGGKGAGLVRMFQLDLPVPPGFVINTRASTAFLTGGEFPPGMWEQTVTAMNWLELASGRRFGHPENPLLVSVRSGAPVSLPGMLTTIKNIGLNEEITEAIARGGAAHFAYDTYLTLLCEFGETILGIPKARLEVIRIKYSTQPQVGVEQVHRLYLDYGVTMPQDPWEQLRIAIGAIFESWKGKVVEDTRERLGIPWNIGTASVVQMMVFGNRDGNSGSGVLHTRDPQTGEDKLTGDFAPVAQGDAVVSGRRTIHDEDWETLTQLPGVMAKLREYSRKLEGEFGWAQDVEFTVETGELYILQSRKAHLSPQASIKAAIGLLEDGVLKSKRQALKHATPFLPRLAIKGFDPEGVAQSKLLSRGVGAVAGAAHGSVVTVRINSDSGPDAAAAKAEAKARELRSQNRGVVLVTDELDTALGSVLGLVDGVVSKRGGLNCHLAILARKSQITTVTGCDELDVTESAAHFGKQLVRTGEPISVDGSVGLVYKGLISIQTRKAASPDEATVRSWMDDLDFRYPWATAAYPELSERELRSLRKIVPRQLTDLPWQSEKARVVELLSRTLPKSSRIGMTVVPAIEGKRLLKELNRAIDEGFEPGIRSCFIGPPRTGSAPWEMGLTRELARKFVEGDPSYVQERRCRIDGTWGTYPDWLKADPSLTELIVMENPPGLGLREEESRARHFVFNVQCDEVGGKVVVELLLDTDQLRDIEHLQQEKAIYIVLNLDVDKEMYKGAVRFRFGSTHVRGAGSNSAFEFWEHESEAFEEALSPKAWRIAKWVRKTVFEDWWQPPFALPYRMMFLSRHELDVLEVQGRTSPAGFVEYTLIYDCKGRDEAKKVQKSST